jgi:hypothetical protein
MTPYESDESARLSVLVDEHGKVVAAVRAPEAGAVDTDGPTDYGIFLPSRQTLHEIRHAGGLESLGNLNVNLEGAEPRLERLE